MIKPFSGLSLLKRCRIATKNFLLFGLALIADDLNSLIDRPGLEKLAPSMSDRPEV
ncbi:MAG: hypothetical protein WCQ20_09040 [Synechococcaceae cyanobacterium ELA739]|jgi:hypothetical protein